MPTKVDGIIRCTLAHEDLRFFSDDYDAQIPGFRGYLGDPLQLCRVWTWSRLVQTFKSMKDFPRVLGIPQIPRKKDGPWDTKHGLNWNAPPICGWNAEGVRPNGDGPQARYALEAIRVAATRWTAQWSSMWPSSTLLLRLLSLGGPPPTRVYT